MHHSTIEAHPLTLRRKYHRCLPSDRGHIAFEHRPKSGFPTTILVAAALLTGCDIPMPGVEHLAPPDWSDAFDAPGNPDGFDTVDTPDTPDIPDEVGNPVRPPFEISSAGGHTCVLTDYGTVWCWGDNAFDQLGTSNEFEPKPVEITGFGSPVTALAAGGLHTCAITEAGEIMCWGFNNCGQLGNGTTDGYWIQHNTKPAPVIGFNGKPVAVSAGHEHTCALTDTGEVMCWGYNQQGQLGIGTIGHGGDPDDIGIPVPQQVVGLEPVLRISAGGDHTCAITNGHVAKCWGNDGVGAVTGNKIGEIPFPTLVPGLGSDVKTISAGGVHTCAMSGFGTVHCWGLIYGFCVPPGSGLPVAAPIKIPGFESGAIAVSAGWTHTCGVDGNLAVACWGQDDGGALGFGDPGLYRCMREALPIGGIASPVISISTGGFHACALLEGGKVVCWGNNSAGQLGDGTAEERIGAVEVVGLPISE
ncbi:MAG: hypothetical protein FWD57_12990 [Polyangiaceae bacterium]|nr:hypothetical protein [Polyangiaceae bacterium]